MITTKRIKLLENAALGADTTTYTEPFGMVGRGVASFYLKAVRSGETSGTLKIEWEGRLPDGSWAQPGVAGDEGEILSQQNITNTTLNIFDRIAGIPYCETCRLKLTVGTGAITVNHLVIEAV